MGTLDRFRAAWSAFTGSGEASRGPPALPALPPHRGEVVERGAFEEASGAGRELLMGIVQAGFSPRRNVVETLIAYDTVPMLRQTVGRISSSIGAARWRLFVSSRRPDARRRVRDIVEMKASAPEDIAARSGLIKAGIDTDDLRELDRHPYLDLLRKPNTVHTGPAVRTLTQIYLDTIGEAFWWMPRNGNALPSSILPIVPHWVRSTPSPSDPVFDVEHRSFNARIPEEEMVWFRELDPVNPYARGCGIAKTLSDELDGDEWAAKHIASFFKNGAMPDAVGMIPGATDDQIKEMIVDWENANRGPWRSHRMHFINAEGEIRELGASFKDMTLVELRKFYNDKVRQTYNVPPEIVGETDESNRATSITARRNMAIFVLVPRLEFLRVEQQEKALPMYPQGDRLLLMYDDPIPEDRDFQLEAAKANPATLTVDEWRDLQGHAAKEDGGGTVHLVPLNLAPSADFTAPAPSAPERAHGPAVQKAAPNRQDVEAMIDLLEPIPLQSHADPIMEALVAEFGQAMMNELGVDLSFNVLSPLVVEHLASASADRIVGLVHETTREEIRLALLEGVANGEGIDRLADRVREVFAGADDVRATRIARTEVLRSSNFARWQGMAQTGLVEVRRWLTAGDSRVRSEPRDNADHRILNGQTKGIREPFVVPAPSRHIGRTAMYPGDFGVAALDIQCRCTTIPVMAAGRGVPPAFTKAATAEELKAAGDAYARRFDRWERRLATELRLAFSEQQTRMLDLLRALSPRGG